ncbi:MAG: electron transport protein SCO1/SenC [Proteobacteria bacterium]|nr:electron transport protein SCO1/SenC [Pseudomonadota bacterium]
MNRRALWILLCVGLAALLAWLSFAWQPPTGVATLHNSAQRSETPTGGDFTLYSADGPVALADYRGKVVLLYFGYTFCPDVCPTSLSVIAQALSMLTAGELERVSSFLISVDPERDTMAVLKAYAPFFHPNIVGISGSAYQVAQVARQYGARYMKQKPDSDGRYAVDHSSYTYVIGADGKLAASLPYASPPQHIVDAIRAQLGAAPAN